mmetsp:Transcript_46067/g.76737  ORF Transcript_46067/g.76737 Transcript_46067/m.76737 type:complete len:244 (-) Transcript_46067:466-1197(-)
MALNPLQMTRGGLPQPMAGELFILQRDGIHFRLDGVSDTGVPLKLQAKGVLYVSTLRIVFVTSPPPSHDARGPGGYVLYAFELPYMGIFEEKFNQPIFGANNLSGSVSALPGGGLLGSARFKITFNEGGVGTFLPMFFSLMAEAHNRLSQDRVPQFVEQVRTGTIVQQAYIDPNDPSVLYITQPVPPPTPQQQQQQQESQYGPAPYALPSHFAQVPHTAYNPTGQPQGTVPPPLTNYGPPPTR